MVDFFFSAPAPYPYKQAPSPIFTQPTAAIPRSTRFTIIRANRSHDRVVRGMTASKAETEPPLQTDDGEYSPPPPLTCVEVTNDTDDDFLRAELSLLSTEQLVDRLVAAESRLKKWERVASELVTTIALSPEMTENYYARQLRELLTNALFELKEVDELRHVECSMPCVSGEKPNIEMIEWVGLDYSEWMLEWAPHSWWVSVSVIGSRWGLGFNSLTSVSGMYLKGVIRCSFSKDLTALRVAFRETPSMDMVVEGSVGWGVVPIPLRERIERLVRMEIVRFVEKRLTGDESMVVVLRRKALAVLSESDIEEATEQAKRASSVSLRSKLLL